jgi:hypothetical protein
VKPACLGILLAALPLFAQQYPSHNNPYTTCAFEYGDESFDGVFKCDLFKIVVEGRKFNRTGRGSFILAGPGSFRSQAGYGDENRQFRWKYDDNVATLTLLGAQFQVTDAGKSMTVGKKTYALADQPSFILKADGKLVLKED